MKGCCCSCKHWRRLHADSDAGRCVVANYRYTEWEHICSRYYGSNWDRVRAAQEAEKGGAK